MSVILKKDDAHRLIDLLPEGSTWDDLMREIYVREAIERGLADSQAGRTKDVAEIKSKYGLEE
jgi:predicted transcriptional regulator